MDIQPLIDSIQPPETDVPYELVEGVLRWRLPNPQDVDHQIIVDTEWLIDNPRRGRGETVVHDAAGFALAVRQRAEPTEVAFYADEPNRALVAVLNDDTTVPGWRDWTVRLQLRTTPEWDTWIGMEGLHDQETFAELIEDGQTDITDPAPALMLELAQTFHATTAANAKLGNLLANGQRQVVWEENTTASGGSSPGAIAIPQAFKLGLKPFVGSARYELVARFRYRLAQAKLQIGYKLDRPENLLRQAFVDLVGTVEQDLGVLTIAGPAPCPTEPFDALTVSSH